MDIKESIIDLGVQYLSRHKIDNARQEAVWLFEHVFGKVEDLSYTGNDDKQHLDEIARLASVKNTKRFNELLARRCNGEPLQYLLGEWEFYGYPMKVGDGVLIPRPETEFIIDIGKDFLARKGDAEDNLIIDLCAGSGCVGIAMSRETGCQSIAVEISEQAATYAKQNITLNKVENLITLHNNDIFDEEFVATMPQADCIFANPPYLSIEDMQNLQREVSFEPELALYGGKNGLDYYKKIFTVWKSKLREGGIFAVEVGDNQASAVAKIMQECGMTPDVMRDYSGTDRIVFTKYKDEGKEKKQKLDELLKEQEALQNT